MQQKYEYTDNPSIQGMWNSFTNVDPSVALAKFPDVSELKVLKILIRVLFAPDWILWVSDVNLHVNLFQTTLSIPRGANMSATDALMQEFKKQNTENVNS